MSVNIYDLTVAKLVINDTFVINSDPIKIGVNAGLVNQSSSNYDL